MDFSVKPLPPLEQNSKSDFNVVDNPHVNRTALDQTRMSTAHKLLQKQVLVSSWVANKKPKTFYNQRKQASTVNTCIPNASKSKIKPELTDCLTPGLVKTIIEWHPFWFSKQKESGPQRFVFKRADNLGHRVCVVLENRGRRLYGSFRDAEHFWAYYSKFEGKRCFYWINRSFEVSTESSLLHFDLEWYTPSRDPTANEKVDAICSVINSNLPTPVKILREDLSRTAP